MTLTELIDYIGKEWPTITDANTCARAILSTFDVNRADTELLDIVISYYDRHQHD